MSSDADAELHHEEEEILLRVKSLTVSVKWGQPHCLWNHVASGLIQWHLCCWNLNLQVLKTGMAGLKESRKERKVPECKVNEAFPSLAAYTGWERAEFLVSVFPQGPGHFLLDRSAGAWNYVVHRN